MRALALARALTLCSCAVLLSAGVALSGTGCAGSGSGGAEDGAAGDRYRAARERMVAEQIRARGVSDTLVLGAMGRVPRHLFVPEALRDRAYSDTPLPIGHGQTISQPYVVALMTESLDLKPGDKVFEVGTGSGYQAAVLAEMGAEVYTMEIVGPLARSASDLLNSLNYNRVSVRVGDAYQGWVEHSPFDAVIVTAAPREVPRPLVDQLKVGGRMVIPVGSQYQDLLLLTKTSEGVERKSLGPVIFVPMTGRAQGDSAGPKPPK